MYLSDFTIPEAEVAYQKAVIRGAWWFLAFLAGCVVVYFVAQKIVQDRHDARCHERQMARIKATEEIGQTGAWAATAKKDNENLKLRKKIALLLEEMDKKDAHIFMLEQTMETMHFGDVADRIREEIENGKNESEDRR